MNKILGKTMQFHCSYCKIYFMLDDPPKNCPYCNSSEAVKVEEIEIKPGIQIEEFLIEQKIGEGSISQVFKAKDTKTDSYFVIKFPKELFRNDLRYKARFESEARILEAIDHKNVLKLLKTIEINNNLALISEYIDGTDLSKILMLEGSIPLVNVIDYLIQASEGLEKVHQKEILHRDIKPDNFLVAKDNTLKVADFGLSKMRSSTMIGDKPHDVSFQGTPAYSAPEQIQGANLSIKSDIYSFGITAYQLCTGRLPFETGTVESILFEHINSDIQSPRLVNPAIPQILDTLILEMTDKDPDSRPENMLEIKQKLIQAKSQLNNRKTEIIVQKQTKKINHVYIFGAFLLLLVAVAAKVIKDYYSKIDEQKNSPSLISENIDYEKILQNHSEMDVSKRLTFLFAQKGEIYVFSSNEILGTPFRNPVKGKIYQESNLDLLADSREASEIPSFTECISALILDNEKFMIFQYPRETVIAEITNNKVIHNLTLPKAISLSLFYINNEQFLISFHKGFCNIVSFSENSVSLQKIPISNKYESIQSIIPTQNNLIFIIEFQKNNERIYKVFKIESVDGEFYISKQKDLTTSELKTSKIIDFNQETSIFITKQRNEYSILKETDNNQFIETQVSKLVEPKAELLTVELSEHGKYLIIVTRQDQIADKLMIDLVETDKFTVKKNIQIEVPDIKILENFQIHAFPENKQILITSNTTTDSNVNLNKVFIFTKPKK